MMKNIIRVLIAKPGLDGHDRGAKVVAQGLRDAGFEVIYTGLHQSPEMVVNAAIQEDVDVIGLSILSGAHLPLVDAIAKKLKIAKTKKPIFVGGIIPSADAARLKKMGVLRVFGPGARMDEIVESIRLLASSGLAEEKQLKSLKSKEKSLKAVPKSLINMGKKPKNKSVSKLKKVVKSKAKKSLRNKKTNELRKP